MPTVSMKTMSSSRWRMRPLVLHHAAAELDDGDLVAELADPAEGLDQHVGFCNGFFHGSGLPSKGARPMARVRM